MSKVAIVYRSGYGHTAVLAERAAEGVRDAGQTPVLLKIENAAQDFAPLIDKISQADAVVFGAPTYMGRRLWRVQSLRRRHRRPRSPRRPATARPPAGWASASPKRPCAGRAAPSRR